MNRQQRRATSKFESKSRREESKPHREDLLGQLGVLAQQIQTTLLEGEEKLEVWDRIDQDRSVLTGFLDRISEAEDEANRQRFVTLRLVSTVNPVDPQDTLAILALEEKYRLEFDGMRALQAIIHLVSTKKGQCQ